MAGRSVGKSKYRKVADELRDNILAGRYAPGAAFPSVKMLCTRFGVSHLTAVKVVETLKGMGLVRARNGVGTFVARNAKHIGLIVPTVRQAEIFPPIVREISRLCQGSGIGIDFADISCETSDNGRATVLETARRMAESDVSGIVFHPLDFGDGAEIVNHAVVKTFREADVPLVILDSDLDAANVLKLLPQIGKRCPDDVLVTGVNDVDLATLVSPTLTTVHQPCEAIAQTAFETLLWRMENPTTEPRRIMVATSLVVRDSTRAGRMR